MKILAVIPARFASTRLPAKPLAMIGYQTLVEHVYNRVKAMNCFDKVLVATDDERIFAPLFQKNISVVMTSQAHQSGTDRCAEVVDNQDVVFDYVVNIQGDEPFVAKEQLDTLLAMLDGEVEIATLARKIETPEVLFNVNRPKVVFGSQNQALYFSRHPIPFIRDLDKKDWLKAADFYEHIGLYGFRTDILRQISNLKQSKLELSERLEQLRWLEAGFQIKIDFSDLETFSVDTPEDLAEARKRFFQ